MAGLQELTYDIVKRGRVWFDAHEPGHPSRKAKIEINGVSEGFEPGCRYTFFGLRHCSQFKSVLVVRIYPKARCSDDYEKRKAQEWIALLEARAREGLWLDRVVRDVAALSIADESWIQKRLVAARAVADDVFWRKRVEDALSRLAADLPGWSSFTENVVVEHCARLEHAGKSVETYRARLRALRRLAGLHD